MRSDGPGHVDDEKFVRPWRYTRAHSVARPPPPGHREREIGGKWPGEKFEISELMGREKELHKGGFFFEELCKTLACSVQLRDLVFANNVADTFSASYLHTCVENKSFYTVQRYLRRGTGLKSDIKEPFYYYSRNAMYITIRFHRFRTPCFR